MNRRARRSNVLGWQKCAAGESQCGRRDAIWRERGQFFPVPLTRWPRHAFRCVWCPRSVPYVAETGSGRQTPYWAALDKKRLWGTRLGTFFLSGVPQIPLGTVWEPRLEMLLGHLVLGRPILSGWFTPRIAPNVHTPSLFPNAAVTHSASTSSSTSG